MEQNNRLTIIHSLAVTIYCVSIKVSIEFLLKRDGTNCVSVYRKLKITPRAKTYLASKRPGAKTARRRNVPDPCLARSTKKKRISSVFRSTENKEFVLLSFQYKNKRTRQSNFFFFGTTFVSLYIFKTCICFKKNAEIQIIKLVKLNKWAMRIINYFIFCHVSNPGVNYGIHQV